MGKIEEGIVEREPEEGFEVVLNTCEDSKGSLIAYST